MRFLKRLAAALLLVLVVPASLYAGAGYDDTFIRDTKAYLTRLEKLGFAGVVLIADDGKPILSEGYGLSDREQKVKWSSRSISDIGSITKQFTAAAILLLEKEGKLSVADPLSKHFSDVPDDKRSITLHQLLTHSSGIVDLEGEHTGDYDPIERDDFVRRIFAQPLESAPGEQYAYSNANYSILGAIIEKITGQSYEAFVREHLFLAHGMKETGYLLPKWDAKRVAVGYGHDGPWGRGIEKPMAKDGPYWVLRANGGIFSTPEDMLRWANALLGGGALPPGSIRRLWTPYVAEGGASSYAYGWSIQTAANGDTLVGHDGGNGYYGATLLLVPRRHIAMCMMTNVSEDLPLWNGIMESVAARMLTGAALPVIPDVVAVPASRLGEVAGAYRFDNDNTISATVDGTGLRLTPQGRDAFAMAVSTRDVNLDRCRDLSARIETIVSGITSGDFNPIYEAYEHRASLETIKSHWDDSMRDWTGKHGEIKGFDVIGTAMLREREMTLVRFNFENGHEDRAYVWDKGADHKLLGVSGRGLASDVHCLPVKGGAFASWDPRSGDSRPFQFDTQDGKRVLRIVAGNQTFIARPE